jgi:hypothetical protein
VSGVGSDFAGETSGLGCATSAQTRQVIVACPVRAREARRDCHVAFALFCFFFALSSELTPEVRMFTWGLLEPPVLIADAVATPQ